MGDILDYCEKILLDESFEGVPVFQKENLNNSRINKVKQKKRSLIKTNDVFIPLNSIDENNNSQCISTNNKLKNINKNISSEENVGVSSINRNECVNGAENDLIISKMSQKIEKLENKNKILENEKKEMKKENEELLKRIELYKDTITKFKNNLDEKENDNEKNNIIKNNNIDKDKDKKIKIIFLFKYKNNQNEKNSNQREEIMANKYEMFLEVKMRLLNLRHLQPGDIKSCYYNNKAINDWFTLEDLNIGDNSYVICEYV